MKYFTKFKKLHLTSLKLKYANELVKCSYCQEAHIASPKPTLIDKFLQEPIILGIETSCDDTGVAIVNGAGNVLGEGYFSQVNTSVRFGGVLPSVASKLHRKNITTAIEHAFTNANLQPSNLSAVAVTVKPGNVRSLRVGCKYAKDICLQNKLPLIPIHHMEAHALTARMLHQIGFPFLCLLVSGGHTLLTLSSSIDKWDIVGNSVDIAIGVAFDHVARRLKISNIPNMENVSGGHAVEILAREGDPHKYPCQNIMTHYNDSNFSFGGLASWIINMINRLEMEQGIEGGRILPQINDICASFQYSATKHLIRKTHKAFRFLDQAQLMNPENKSLVISGGVASNQFIKNAFVKLCEAEDYKLFVPPPKLCTDNGIMIAWNGIERWMANSGIIYDQVVIENIQVESKCPLGPDLSEEQRSMNLQKPAYIKF